MMKFILIFISFFYTSSTSINVCRDNTTFVDANFTQLINTVDSLLLNCPSADGIGKAVRLAFHDCVSGCNGCVDLQNIDNHGLERPVNLAARAYAKFRKTKFYGKYFLSRADIYALFGFRAIYLSSNRPNITLPTCEFKIGRKDCAGPQDNKEIFASALGNWKVISEFFQKEFKFTTQEVVALLGAHTLGRTWRESSNFTGPWVAHNNRVFSNAYYQNMLDRTGDIKYVPEKSFFGKQQWSSLGDKQANKNFQGTRVMLNSDMCLLKKFNVDADGVPDCTYKTCQTNEETAGWVQTYANSEPKFKADFSKVFQKMLEHGYEGTNTLIDIIPNSTNEIQLDRKNEIVKMILTNFQNSSIKQQFKVFHFVFNKKYDFNSEEALKRYRIFKSNMKIIKEQNKLEPETNKYGINFYTDMTFEEFFKERFRVDSVHLNEFNENEINQYSHLELYQ